jgi:hypothetical protein
VFINALCTTSRASREPGNQQINEINAVTPWLTQDDWLAWPSKPSFPHTSSDVPHFFWGNYQCYQPAHFGVWGLLWTAKPAKRGHLEERTPVYREFAWIPKVSGSVNAVLCRWHLSGEDYLVRLQRGLALSTCFSVERTPV